MFNSFSSKQNEQKKRHIWTQHWSVWVLSWMSSCESRHSCSTRVEVHIFKNL